MIVTGDIENILIQDLKPLGIPIFKKDAIPEGKVTEERIVVITSSLKDGTYWEKGFVNVNFCVPDIKMSNICVADKSRLLELERIAKSIESLSTHDGTTYMYSVYEIGQEKDTELECHFVNARILFEVLNVIN